MFLKHWLPSLFVFLLWVPQTHADWSARVYQRVSPDVPFVVDSVQARQLDTRAPIVLTFWWVRCALRVKTMSATRHQLRKRLRRTRTIRLGSHRRTG